MKHNEHYRKVEFNYSLCLEHLSNGNEHAAKLVVVKFLKQFGSETNPADQIPKANFQNLFNIATNRGLTDFLNFLMRETTEKALANSTPSPKTLLDDYFNGENRMFGKVAKSMRDSVGSVLEATSKYVSSENTNDETKYNYSDFQKALAKRNWEEFYKIIANKSFAESIPDGANPAIELLALGDAELVAVTTLYNNLNTFFHKDPAKMYFFFNVVVGLNANGVDIEQYINISKEVLREKNSISIIGEKGPFSALLTAIKLLEKPPENLLQINLINLQSDEFDILPSIYLDPKEIGVESSQCKWWRDYCKWANKEAENLQTKLTLRRYLLAKVDELKDQTGIKVVLIKESIKDIEVNKNNVKITFDKDSEINSKMLVFSTDFQHVQSDSLRLLVAKKSIQISSGSIKVSANGKLFIPLDTSKIIHDKYVESKNLFATGGLYLPILKSKTMSFCSGNIAGRGDGKLRNTFDSIVHSIEFLGGEISKTFSALTRINSDVAVEEEKLLANC